MHEQKNINYNRHPVKAGIIFLVPLFVALILAAFHVFQVKFDNDTKLSNALADKTSEGLQEIREKTEHVIKSYQKCENVYDKGTFIFFHELKICRDDVLSAMNELREARNRYAPIMDTASLVLTDDLLKEEWENARQLSLDAYSTDLFEQDFVRAFWEDICFRQRHVPDKEAPASLNENAERSASEISDQMFHQNVEYYKIRDFVIPSLHYMQDILEAQTRRVRGLDGAQRMAAALRDYNSLIQEQKNYQPIQDKHPFQNGIMRREQSRNFTSSMTSKNGEDLEQPLELARSSDAKARLPYEALLGRVDIAKRLVDCGVLKREALEVIEKAGDPKRQNMADR